jgi:sec-independent protein translocase protein TatA
MYVTLGFIEGALSPFHLLVLLVLGMLFFGKRLPEVGRSLGKGIVEFKKGLKGLEDDVDGGSGASPVEPPVARVPPRLPPSAPRFEDNPNPPQA